MVSVKGAFQKLYLAASGILHMDLGQGDWADSTGQAFCFMLGSTHQKGI